VDINKRRSQAQHEIRRTSREDAPTGWRKKRTSADGNEDSETASDGTNGAALQANASTLPSGPDRVQVDYGTGTTIPEMGISQTSINCRQKRSIGPQRKRRKMMPKGPKGEKAPADVISAAVVVGRIATGEIDGGGEPCY
jgi:hypothetical protein